MEIPNQIQSKWDERGSDEIQRRFMKQVLGKLPATLQSYFNQQLRIWDTLLPYERQYLSTVLGYLEDLSESELWQLFDGIRRVEDKMGVSAWSSYSTRDQTLENASLLARSPYYLEWRKEVENVFERIERGTQARGGETGPSPHRLILLIFPSFLPMSADTLWQMWPSTGKQLRIDLNNSQDERSLLRGLFSATEPAGHADSSGLLESLARKTAHSFSDVWVLDAGSMLSGFLGGEKPQTEQSRYATVLSFERLEPIREKFLAEVNRARHKLSSVDEIYDQLREMEIDSFCPPEVNRHPLIREFVRSLLLSGNGSPLFGNAFVEWGAAELFRRARPSVLIGYFGTRDKPKPFTSVAVFENQSVASPLPPVKDLAGSALDAEVLAYYTWLAAARYPEYQGALTLCIAGSLSTVFVVGPSENPFAAESEPLSLPKISSLLGAWLA
jgi:hypothetical protein